MAEYELCESFDCDADNTSEDFETHRSDGTVTTGERVRALVGRGMHYLSTKDAPGVLRTLRRPELTAEQGIAMIYCFHAKCAIYRHEGSGDQSRSSKADSDGCSSIKPFSEDEDDEVTSERRPPGKRPHADVEPDDAGPADVIKETVSDVLRFMPSATAPFVFQQIARKAGLADTVGYVLRCGKDLRCVMEVFRGEDLKDLSAALMKLGRSKTDIKKAALEAGADQADIDDAGLNSSAQIECLVSMATGSDLAADGDHARKGKDSLSR